MSALVIIISILAVLTLSALSYAAGLRYGKALGWQEHYFENVERDRARRERNGQFKAKEARGT